MNAPQPRYYWLLLVLLTLVIATVTFTRYLHKHRRSSLPMPPKVFVNSDPDFDQNAIEPDFDVRALERTLDTLWTEIEHVPIQVACTLGRTDCDGIRKRKYNFNPGKGRLILRVSLQVSDYENPAALKEELTRLKEKGSDSFGLTYGYDNLWVTSTKLVWFGAGCTYASFNYERMVTAVRKALHAEGLRPFLDCDCGGGCV